MLFKKNNISVLVAPLDWGLGHATRCIPLIKILQKSGCQVIIAASGPHKLLLQNEFPELQFLELAGYGIRYARKNVLLRLTLQLPGFLRSIKKEHQWLQQIIQEYDINAIISDNRYGLYSKKVPCVFITHQLQVKPPRLFRWMEKMVRKRIYKFISPFSTCWVPDMEEANKGLGGTLSHPAVLPLIPTQYIGWLTRFLPQPVLEKKYKLLISLSGPEPQRTLLEEILLSQSATIKGQVLIVRGLPGNDKPGSPIPTIAVSTSHCKTGINQSSNITIINHLPGKDLQHTIAETEFFISRCGYSTLMDLQAVSCRCIFIPTPGQTEQEYLGWQIAASGKALVLQQKKINLAAALEKAARVPLFSDGNYRNEVLEKIVADWLAGIRNG